MSRPLDIVIDVRCLQDPNYRGRGVGRHSANLLRYARSYLPRTARLIGLVNDHAEPLWPEHAALLDQIRVTTYTGTFTRPTWFVELSPMTHDPLFVAGIVSRPEVFKATVIYDFIPEDEPDRYLPTPLTRLEYGLCKFWLASYDAFMPISSSSAERLRELLPIDDKRITITGAPIAPIFEESRRRPESDGNVLLAVGGGDPRKNVECVIRAYSLCDQLQRQGVPLVITGQYAPAYVSSLRAMHLDLGGNPTLLQMPGKVSDQVLVELYRRAVCVVVPSKAEGFSLPVVEAMAVGTPVVASKIPAHEELLPSDFLFEPDDSGTVAELIARLVDDAGFRHELVVSTNGVWQRFLGPEVARGFWLACTTRAAERRERPAPTAVRRDRRPKVAFLTPLPPDQSGVADYSAASLRELSKLVDVYVFTDTAHPIPIDGVRVVSPITKFPFVSPDFDRVVGVVGNSHFHHRIFDNLLHHGGACISHDCRMLSFYGLVLGMPRAQWQATRELGRPLKDGELHEWFDNEDRLKTLFLGELAAACEPLCVHSKVTAGLVRERYRVDPILLPYAIHRPFPPDALTAEARAKARSELDFAMNEVAIATFGFAHATKGVEECIWALELLRRWKVPASLHFVGGLPDKLPYYQSLCRRLGVQDHVRFVGSASAFVDERDYRRYLQAADLGIQLRTYGFGGLSGSLLDCIAAGLPTVANEDLAEAMEAPDYVARVPDTLSPILIAEALASLLDSGIHEHRSEEARGAYYAEHNFAVYVRRLCQALAIEVPSETAMQSQREISPHTL